MISRRPVRATLSFAVLCCVAVLSVACAHNEEASDAAVVNKSTQSHGSAASQLGIPTSAPLSGPEPGSHMTINLSSGRSFILSLPENYTAQKEWPVVLAFHGWGQSAESLRGYSRLDAAQAITVFPTGENKAWSPAPYAVTRGSEDKKFVLDILDSLRATYNVDDSRLFATGMSNGGGFAAYLACQMPGIFYSVATISAAYYEDILKDCAHEPVGRLDMHGTDDPIVSYYGGTRHETNYFSVEFVLEQDRKRNECSEKVETHRLVNNALDMHWTGCSAPLEHIRIGGGSHVWPGGTADNNNEVGKFFATDRVLDFFGIPGRPDGTRDT
ncbi:alpha/beta hydrolase family esterase [Corynebacterium macginleyi]|uniref:alpha/beta hydrolase family esterase n=1 Tax=Corynebacterium macginleyi TaxID=38290 RepID=UPI00217F20E7|nr:alpha/beta hydrolase-fold protein [Corynebacterium macginleyi]